MIAKKTMVSKKWLDIEEMTIQNIKDFLFSIDKSRLPVLDDKNKVRYIIHDSMLSKPYKNSNGDSTDIVPTESIKTFVDNIKEVISEIHYIQETEKLENARKLMSEKSHCKDIFVINKEGELVGWLTDTLILRYINTAK